MKKIGEILDKIGKPGNFEVVHFFPVSVPVISIYMGSWNLEISGLCVSKIRGVRADVKQVNKIET